MNTAYLLLGSNIGDRNKYLSDAIKLIEKNIGKIILKSSVYDTAAWGNEDQNSFLNQVICITTVLSAEKLLQQILKIEKQLGRQRNKKWEARIIDIDILFFNNEIIDWEFLKVPHPHLHERRFALVPINEIAPDLIHPVFKKSIRNLLDECPDKLVVNIYPH